LGAKRDFVATVLFRKKFETDLMSFVVYRLDLSDSLTFNDQRNLADWADIADQQPSIPPT
jgi:hypothetical protein